MSVPVPVSVPVRALPPLVLLVFLAGCSGPGWQGDGLGDSGTDCPASVPVADGFRVSVPPTVGDADEPGTARTEGYCVESAPKDAGGDAGVRRGVVDGVAWFPVDGAGAYWFRLHVQMPDDPWCAYTLHAEAEHPGAGVVDVDLERRGGVCA